MKMPSAWNKIEASSSTVNASSLDMSAEIAGEGLCPECKTPMDKVLSGDLPTLVCVKDRIVLPIKD